ncbi:MAG: hypothetical protein JST30_03415 [Armatimonadetes bacterium]|nr:hypothetical protein [Armatimonadota bacterium]
MKSNGLRDFFLLTGALLVLRLLLGFLTVPPGPAAFLSVVSSIVFVGIPIVALYRAADYGWGRSGGPSEDVGTSPTRSGAKVLAWLLVSGAVLHAAAALALRTVLPATGPATVLGQAVVQCGIALWTLGLGGLVGLLIKDRNIILPVALFLAALDMFLVFHPQAPTARLVRQNPQFFQSMAVSVPAVRETSSEAAPVGASVEPQAFVGPADLLFIAMFFVGMSRFGMPLSRTAKWVAPVMVVYLLIVLSKLNLNMLPALVPIGGTVLLVNRREFNLDRSEKAMVWGIAVFSVLLAGFGLYGHFTDRRPTVQTAPSMPGNVQAPPEQAKTPLPGR